MDKRPMKFLEQLGNVFNNEKKKKDYNSLYSQSQMFF